MRVFQQMSTQKRMITPSDDPLASAQTINLAQAQAMDKRYGENREVAMRSLGEEENILNAVNPGTGVQTRLVEAATGTLSDADRSTLATVMESSLETLLGFANTKDGSGQYLFSGSQGIPRLLSVRVTLTPIKATVIAVMFRLSRTVSWTLQTMAA